MGYFLGVHRWKYDGERQLLLHRKQHYRRLHGGGDLRNIHHRGVSWWLSSYGRVHAYDCIQLKFEQHIRLSGDIRNDCLPRI